MSSAGRTASFARRPTRSRVARACLPLLACALPVAGAAQQLGGAAADEATQAPATLLAPLVVTATRRAEEALLVPAALDVIEGEEIARARPRVDLSEVLDRIPGVVARDRQNQAQDLQVSIRGFGARSAFGVRGVRLFSDGIPATMPDGQGQVSHFLLESAGRIEVLRGPFSALYGNASGGVVEVFTAAAPPQPMLRGGVVAGSDGLSRQALSWHGPWQDDAGDALLDLVQVHDDGYRRHSRAMRRQGQALLRGGFGSDGRFTLLLNTLELAAQDPQGLTAAQLQGDRRAASAGALAFDTRKQVRQSQLGGRLAYPLGDGSRIEATVHAGRRATAQMLSIPAFVQQASPLQGGGAIDLDRDYHGADLRWTWEGGWGDATLTLAAGVQHAVADEARLGFENFLGGELGVIGALRRDEFNRVASTDLYLQAALAPAPRWRLQAGVRHSAVDFRSDDRFIRTDNPDDSGTLAFSRSSPVLGALFRATPWLSVFANAGQGFETPTFAELAYRSDGEGGLNDALAPAVSRSIEAGLRARRGRFEAAAVVFQSRTDDELVVVANSGGRSTYGNATLTRRRGLELSVAAQLAPRWHAALAWTWLDARYLEDFGVCTAPPCAATDLLIEAGWRIPGLARQSAWAQVRFAAHQGLDLVLEGRFVDRVFADDANQAFAPAYARMDLALERRLSLGRYDWTGFARIDNLLDRDIVGSVIVNEGNGRYFEPAPGRGWSLGLSVARRF